jgi:hypothetical protein
VFVIDFLFLFVLHSTDDVLYYDVCPSLPACFVAIDLHFYTSTGVQWCGECKIVKIPNLYRRRRRRLINNYQISHLTPFIFSVTFVEFFFSAFFVVVVRECRVKDSAIECRGFCFKGLRGR